MPGRLPPRVIRALRIPLGRERRLERELDEEIRFHLAMRVEHLVARGLSRHAAEDEAMRRFGAIDDVRPTLLAAAYHREGRLTMLERLDALRHDLSYALRQLQRAPGLTAGVVLTFALGIGANATMFGVIDNLLLRPPAHVVAPERVYVASVVQHFGADEWTQETISYPIYTDLRDHARGLDAVAAVAYPSGVGIGRGADAWRATGQEVSASYFPLLGVRPALGRFFTADEDRLVGGSTVAVISDGLWRGRFGGDVNVIGRTLDIGAMHFTIVGVAPRGFGGPWKEPIEIWLPIATTETARFGAAKWAEERQAYWMRLITRIGAGETPSQATAKVTAAARAGDATTSRPDPKLRMSLESILPTQRAERSTEFRVWTLLSGVAVLVLLIACANIANLLLARSIRRRREIAVRLALGVSRTRLVRQLVTESLLLALAGGAAALAVARWGGDALRGALLGNLEIGGSLVDARVFAFTATIAILVGVLTGIVPALNASRMQLTDALKAGGRGGGLQGRRLRTALLLAQAMLSVVLLIGAGLFVRSLRNANAVDLGMDVRHALAVQVDMEEARFTPARAEEALRMLADRARHTNGIRAVGIAMQLPFAMSWGESLKVPGLDSLPRVKDGGPYVNAVDSGFFDAVGVHIVRGRGITGEDQRLRAHVAVVNELMAKLYWPGQNAIGKCMKIGGDTMPCSEVVGIAKKAHRQTIIEDDQVLQYYVPVTAAPAGMRQRIIFARTSDEDADRAAIALQRALQATASDMPYVSVRPMSRLLTSELRPWTLGASLLTAFGALALLLAAVGLYSVITYGVVQRLHEMGVRVALGASRGDILGLVLGQGVRVVLAGTAAGILVALALAPLVRSLMFGVSPRDPLVLGAVAAVLLAVAVVASLVPAVRATRVDPVTSLRGE